MAIQERREKKHSIKEPQGAALKNLRQRRRQGRAHSSGSHFNHSPEEGTVMFVLAQGRSQHVPLGAFSFSARGHHVDLSSPP